MRIAGPSTRPIRPRFLGSGCGLSLSATPSSSSGGAAGFALVAIHASAERRKCEAELMVCWLKTGSGLGKFCPLTRSRRRDGLAGRATATRKTHADPEAFAVAWAVHWIFPQIRRRPRRGRSFVENTFLVGLSQQMATNRAMEVIANNLANLSTPAFKRESTEFEQYAVPVAATEAEGGGTVKVSFVLDRGVTRDLSDGRLDQTGGMLDLAITGPGYFVV